MVQFFIFRSDCLQVQEQGPCISPLTAPELQYNFDNYEENEIVQLSRRVKRQLAEVHVKVVHLFLEEWQGK
jgi:hypothetical protein